MMPQSGKERLQRLKQKKIKRLVRQWRRFYNLFQLSQIWHSLRLTSYLNLTHNKVKSPVRFQIDKPCKKNFLTFQTIQAWMILNRDKQHQRNMSLLTNIMMNTVIFFQRLTNKLTMVQEEWDYLRITEDTSPTLTLLKLTLLKRATHSQFGQHGISCQQHGISSHLYGCGWVVFL